MSASSRAMKPSGLGWAGDIPADWDVAKICLIAKLESGHTPSRQHPEYWVPSECTIPWFSLADVWQLREGTQEYLGETSECISPMGIAHSAARLLPAGTVVLSRTASVGFAGIMPRPMATTQDFANWVPGERVISEYLLYALRAMRDEFSRVMTGSTHQTIYMPDIRRLAIPVPPRDEQERIVAELRARLPRVDILIAKQEQLLTLLAEKRQGLITQAVTKGLDLKAVMKDSGVDWIGDVPAHWSVMPAKLLGWYRGGAGFPDDEQGQQGLELPFYKVRDLSDEGVRDDVLADSEHTIDRVTARRLRATVFPTGTIVFAKVGAALLLRRFRTLSREACIDNNMMGWVLNPARMMTRYALLATILLRFDLIVNPGTVPSLNGSVFGRQPIPVPPLAEQERIVAHVYNELRRLDGLAQRAAAMVEKLREYRQALITAAVTGQLDAGSAPKTALPTSHYAEAEVA